MSLDQSEVFIAFILKDFREKSNIVVISEVSFDPCNDGRGPFDNERFKPILLVEVRVHELLKSFLWGAHLFALPVEFDFLAVHVMNCVF